MRYDSNLAYDLHFEDYNTQREQKVAEQKAKTKTAARARSLKLHKSILICALIFAICAGFMICRNVAVYEGRNEIEDLQKELNSLKEYSSQKSFELDQNLNLESVEEIARTRLGMVRPEKYQTVYVNIKQDDVTEITADQVEGIGGLFGIFDSKEE